MLKIGQIVRYEGGRLWRVGMVTESRARLDPVSGNIANLAAHSVAFTTYGGSVNLSPNAVVEEVDEAELGDEDRRRISKLIERNQTEQEKHTMAAVEQTPVEKAKAKAAAIKASKAAPKAAAPAPAAAAKVKPSAVAAQPGAAPISADKVANAERLAKIKEKKAAEAKEKAEKRAAAPKADKTMKPCKCGCGMQIASNFAQGHDARYKSWLLKVERGEMAVKDLPGPVQKMHEWKKSGDGYVPTKDYKGQPYKLQDA